MIIKNSIKIINPKKKLKVNLIEELCEMTIARWKLIEIKKENGNTVVRNESEIKKGQNFIIKQEYDYTDLKKLIPFSVNIPF